MYLTVRKYSPFLYMYTLKKKLILERGEVREKER